MHYQDRVIRITQDALDTLFRTASAMPADKLEWKPLDAGRSVLEQMQECAQVPVWFSAILKARAMPPLDENAYVRALEERQQWATLDECRHICLANTEELFAVIREFPDEELERKVFLPFNGGIERTMSDIMLSHYSNTPYHTGQINYIQTLYGDFEMH